MERLILALAVVALALALAYSTCVVYGSNVTKVVCVCKCHCVVNVRSLVEKLEEVTKLLREEVSLLKNLTLLQEESHSTLLNLSKSIAEVPSAVARLARRGLSNFTISNNVTGSTVPAPFPDSTCPDIVQQLLVGIPELRCFAPSSWLGPSGWVTVVNAAVIGLLAAVSLWSIVAEISTGTEPAAAFRRCGGLLIKCCVAGLFLTLLPHIVSTWNSLVFAVTNWGVVDTFFTAWTVVTVLTVLPLMVPILGAAIPAVSKIPGSILQMHIVVTGLLGLLLYIKLLIALIVQIALPISIALQEVRIRALRSLGLAIESTFWGLLIGTLLGAAMTQLIGGMYVKAGEVAIQGVSSLVHGSAAALAAASDYIKCSIFGWLFHCSPRSAIQELLTATRDVAVGISALLVQTPLLLMLAVLGAATPLFTVVLTLWKKWTPLQFMDVMIGATTGIYFTAQEYGRARRELARKIVERIAERRKEAKTGHNS